MDKLFGLRAYGDGRLVGQRPTMGKALYQREAIAPEAQVPDSRQGILGQ